MTPTPSPAQRRVLNIDGVRLEGWDAKNRPVVSAMLGIPNQLRRWAILRSGEPTNVTEPVTATDWQYVTAKDVVPKDFTRYGTVKKVSSSGNLRVLSGHFWQRTLHEAAPVEVLRT